MKTFLKVLFIGIVTTIVRSITQTIISSVTHTVLQPSTFMKNGMFPIIFMIYGIITYSTIAALFLFIKSSLSGHRIIKGLKYGFSCATIWTIYLLEPLPHVNLIDKITYPLADSVALIIMGLLIGSLLTKSTTRKEKDQQHKSILLIDTFCITACFINGRIILYFAFNIYSSFNTQNLYTVLWMMFTGFVIAMVVQWYIKSLNKENPTKKAVFSSMILFGVNLLLFNFFMLLVFDANIIDLVIRTIVDICSITIGLLLLPVSIQSKKKI